MSIQNLQIWSNDINIDSLTNVAQRREITEEEFKDGLTRGASFSAQQYNQLMFLLTSYATPHWSCPFLLSDKVAVPDTALEMNGQAITAQDFPLLHSVYGSNLDNIAAPAGFKYVVRKQ